MLENMCVSLCVSVCVSVQQGQQGQREDNEATRRAQEENLFQFKNFRHARNTKSELTATVFSSVLCPLPPAPFHPKHHTPCPGGQLARLVRGRGHLYNCWRAVKAAQTFVRFSLCHDTLQGLVTDMSETFQAPPKKI